jgi:hypothetical protein
MFYKEKVAVFLGIASSMVIDLCGGVRFCLVFLLFSNHIQLLFPYKTLRDWFL